MIRSAFFVFLLLASVISAQTISYQGLCTDASGSPRADGSYSVKFRLVEKGTELWTETQTVQLKSGLFSAALGSAVPIPAGLFAQHKSTQLTVQIGTEPEFPASPLTYSPYAFSASSADKSDSALYLKANSGTGITADSLLKANGELSEQILVLANRVTALEKMLAPKARTGMVTNLGVGTATLNAGGNPAGKTADGWIRYSTIKPAIADDISGFRPNQVTSLGSGNGEVAYSAPLSNLTANTKYYYWAVVTNGITSFGAIDSFTALPSAPSAVTKAASNVNSTSATLNGAGTPNWNDAIGWFRYSTRMPASADDLSGVKVPTIGSSIGMTGTQMGFSFPLTGLTPGTTYYYWSCASNEYGTTFGNILSFTTPQ